MKGFSFGFRCLISHPSNILASSKPRTSGVQEWIPILNKGSFTNGEIVRQQCWKIVKCMDGMSCTYVTSSEWAARIKPVQEKELLGRKTVALNNKDQTNDSSIYDEYRRKKNPQRPITDKKNPQSFWPPNPLKISYGRHWGVVRRAMIWSFRVSTWQVRRVRNSGGTGFGLELNVKPVWLLRCR